MGGRMSNRDDTKKTRKIVKRPTLVVIDRHALTRTCFAKQLEAELDGIEVIKMATAADAGDAAGADVRLIIINIEDRTLTDLAVVRDVAVLREAFPDASLAVLSGLDEDDMLVNAHRLRVNGFFPITTPIDLAIAGLRLILAGGTYFPRQVDIARNEPPGDANGRNGHGPSETPAEIVHVDHRSVWTAGRRAPARLTAREMQVLGEVQRGHPNKVIAAKLSMSENTVKMHVQHIMRKLGARNRTETVLLSMRSNGAGTPSTAEG
jgi:DNA-binding NarL/FixJ family response regulator